MDFNLFNNGITISYHFVDVAYVFLQISTKFVILKFFALHFKRLKLIIEQLIHY